MEKKRKSSKGFSMVEMIIVMAIMAIILTMSFGGYYMIRKSTINGATKDVETILEKAKGYATTVDNDETFVEFYISKNTLSAYIGYVNTDASGNKVISEKHNVAMGKKVTLEFDDNVVTKVKLTETFSVRVYFDKRSGGVSKVCFISGSTESSVLTAGSTHANLTIKFATGEFSKEGKLTLYYENGTVE